MRYCDSCAFSIKLVRMSEQIVKLASEVYIPLIIQVEAVED